MDKNNHPKLIKRFELTDVKSLMEILKGIPKDAKIYANGTYGYMHIGTDVEGFLSITFDDSDFEEEYKTE